MTSNDAPFPLSSFPYTETASKKTTATVYVSLGSNIEPETNLKRAIQLLRMKSAVRAISSAYRTAPQGFVEQADFLNMAVCVETRLDPTTFKREVVDWIERESGRVRDPHNMNAPRTIDLDISLWNDTVFEYGEKPWRVPDPDILRFAHVAIPLAEIAPNYLHPLEHITLMEIASRFNGETFERFSLTFP